MRRRLSNGWLRRYAAKATKSWKSIWSYAPRWRKLASNEKEKERENYKVKNIQLGYLDITFFRDDFRRTEKPLEANKTNIDFIVENKKVIFIDDVLFTGRTIRAALDALLSFGRPAKVELCVLIDRIYNRDLPINADYVGKSVNTLPTEKVLVEWTEQGHEADRIWLIPQPE